MHTIRMREIVSDRERVRLTCPYCGEALSTTVWVQLNGYIRVNETVALWMSGHNVECGVRDENFIVTPLRRAQSA